MTPTPSPPRHSTALIQDLELQRRSGPLRQILIPPCPALLQRLQQAMAAAEPDLNEIARIASADVAMSATLLRNANAARYAAGQPVATTGRALDRLGVKTAAALMTAFLLGHAMPVSHPRLRDFWQQATERARTLHFIARQLPGLAPAVAQTYGLFQHVGIPVLLQSMRGYGSTLVEAQARIDRPFVATENANHRTDHAVAGALLAHAWRLPPLLVAAIRLHHDLGVIDETGAEPEVRTLVAAGLVAEALQRQREGLPPQADWVAHGPAALAWLGVADAELEDWREALGSDVEMADAQPG